MSSIFLLNIGHESEILNDSPSYTQPARVSIIRRSLELLPIWFADKNDFVLVDNISSIEYSTVLKDLGFDIPKAILPKQLKYIKEATFKPWGISKTIIRRLYNLSDIYNLKNALQYPEWNEDLKHINSRLFAREILLHMKDLNILSKLILIPITLRNIKEVESLLADERKKILIKSPYSSSGIGLLWLRNGIEKSERQILEGMFKKQKIVTAEKIYEKVIDFALEYSRFSQGDNFTLVGISLFITNSKGAYEGNILKSQNKIRQSILQYISNDELKKTEIVLNEIINKYCRHTSLTCVGIDMMITKDGNEYILHPCVEVNPRYNMGYTSVKLFEKYVCNESEGVYKIQFGKPKQIKEFANEQSQKYPLVLKDKKIKKGFLQLTALGTDTNYLAYIIIE